MKAILVFVSTLDGKITKWNDPLVRHWSSKADQDYLNKIWKNSRLIILGSNTYNASPIKPSPAHHLVIMTSQPMRYKEKEIAGQIEFTDESPESLVERFEKQGEQQLLIMGGAKVATSYLKAQLIDELWLTIEPILFGSGQNIVIAENLDIHLCLLSFKKVNAQGTLITKYTVIKDNANIKTG